MLGTSRPNPYVGETNGAGVMGPRGCEPLGRDYPYRIARALPYWGPVKFTGFNASATPQLVAKANPNRGWLILASLVVGNGVSVCVLGFAPLRDPLTHSPPGFAKGATFAANETFSFYDESNYQGAGALITSEWWCTTFPGGVTGAYYVYEQDFYG